MKKIAAVTYISFFDNEMMQRVFEVDKDANWKDVVHFAIEDGIMGGGDYEDDLWEWLNSLSNDLDDARSEMVNGEMDFCVTFKEG